MAMADDVLTLVASMHRRALVMLSSSSGLPLQGLQQGTRAMKSKLSRGTARRLLHLELAYGIARHIAHQKAEDLLQQLGQELSQVGVVAGLAQVSSRAAWLESQQRQPKHFEEHH